MKEIFVNQQTGKTHTATWASIISGIGGIIVLLGACFPKFTQLTWGTAIPFAMLLFGVGGVGIGTMLKKNGGQNG